MNSPLILKHSLLRFKKYMEYKFIEFEMAGPKGHVGPIGPDGPSGDSFNVIDDALTIRQFEKKYNVDLRYGMPVYETPRSLAENTYATLYNVFKDEIIKNNMILEFQDLDFLFRNDPGAIKQLKDDVLEKCLNKLMHTVKKYKKLLDYFNEPRDISF